MTIQTCLPDTRSVTLLTDCSSRSRAYSGGGLSGHLLRLNGNAGGASTALGAVVTSAVMGAYLSIGAPHGRQSSPERSAIGIGDRSPLGTPNPGQGRQSEA